ncbi:major capsid protein [Brachybacterium kimchii]|uniref:Major capsid protein n=1 Tax=Brachybacterium kimchii TaxID=2942909 RepID=A0ABY4N979_9MICO|nr:major capsid protein [Brachybacterium kimchii]UQN30661.1 major capsid protein [Brachybacterium kimchii]
MQYHDSVINAEEASTFAREASADQDTQFLYSFQLPTKTVDDLDYAFQQGGSQLIAAAAYRTFDTEAPLGANPEGIEVKGKLPPISEKTPITEWQRLKLYRRDDAMRTAFENHAVNRGKAIATRLELARSEALNYGRVTLNENGLEATVDFGRDAALSPTVTTPWDEADTAGALDDLIAWAQAVQDLSGEMPGRLYGSTKVRTLLQRNKQVISAAQGTNTTTSRISADALNVVLESEGLPAFTTYDKQVLTRANGRRRIQPENRIVFAPAPGDSVSDESGTSGVLGSTAVGIPAEALNGQYGIAEANQAGIFAAVMHGTDPEGFWTLASAIALPVVELPNATASVEVVGA